MLNVDAKELALNFLSLLLEKVAVRNRQIYFSALMLFQKPIDERRTVTDIVLLKRESKLG